MPPAAYHLAMRLQAAREMLRQPTFDITTTALQFGFSSSQHFSTLFKRAFRVTPRNWKASGEKGLAAGRRIHHRNRAGAGLRLDPAA